MAFPNGKYVIRCDRNDFLLLLGQPSYSSHTLFNFSPVSVQISYWLIENGFSVLIAACDTFRAGAVEQLRTHQRRLNSLHPPEKHGGRPVVQLYEKGYGKDAAGIAMEAIAYGKRNGPSVDPLPQKKNCSSLLSVPCKTIYVKHLNILSHCNIIPGYIGDLMRQNSKYSAHD